MSTMIHVEVENNDSEQSSQDEEEIAPFALGTIHKETPNPTKSKYQPKNTIENLEKVEQTSKEMMQDSIIVEATKAVSQERKDQNPLNISELMREADNTVATTYSSDGSVATDVTSNVKKLKTRISSNNSFSVEIFIPQTTLRNVMDNISNPDLLRVWCNPIIHVFVTKESRRRRPEEEFDGEWIEGAATLRTPRGYTMLNMLSCIKTYLGFSSHGKISLFIERSRGKLTLSIGPFAGVSTIQHSYTFLQKDRGVVVTDDVSIQQRKNNCVTKYFCPSVDSFVDQTVCSMEDMKVLVEHGETAVESVSFDDGGITPLLGGPAL